MDKRLKTWFSKNKLLSIGVVAGAIVGYVYWENIGCISGSCAITSQPINSTVYGAIMGGLLFSVFKSDKSKQKSNEEK